MSNRLHSLKIWYLKYVETAQLNNIEEDHWKRDKWGKTDTCRYLILMTMLLIDLSWFLHEIWYLRTATISWIKKNTLKGVEMLKLILLNCFERSICHMFLPWTEEKFSIEQTFRTNQFHFTFLFLILNKWTHSSNCHEEENCLRLYFVVVVVPRTQICCANLTASKNLNITNTISYYPLNNKKK